jgi:hypothetical protein
MLWNSIVKNWKKSTCIKIKWQSQHDQKILFCLIAIKTITATKKILSINLYKKSSWDLVYIKYFFNLWESWGHGDRFS